MPFNRLLARRQNQHWQHTKSVRSACEVQPVILSMKSQMSRHPLKAEAVGAAEAAKAVEAVEAVDVVEAVERL